MNDRSDIDRVLGHWFEDGPTVMPDRVADVVAHRISLRPQRRSRRLLWRFPMNSAMKYGLAAAAVVIVAVVGYNLLPRGPSIGGPIPSKTPAPTVTASVPSPSPAPGVVDASAFGVPLSLTLSGGWTKDGISPSNLDLQRGDTDLGFHPLSMVTLPGATVADPWIPVPADFVGWIGQRPEFTAFQNRPVTVGGRTGTEIDAEFVWKEGTAKGEFLRYGSGAWLYDQTDAGYRARFIMLPGSSGVGGLVIVVVAKDAEFEAATASLDVVLATVQFLGPTASPSS